jgi:nicotinate-nucleotide pyrophosphorylase (carboxylating)
MYFDDIILRAFKEDMPFGDITSDCIFNDMHSSKARFIAKDSGIISGIDVAKRVFELLDAEIKFKKLVEDGSRVKFGDIIAEVDGKTKAMLKAERTALNLMQRLSGISTKTNLFYNEIKDLPVSIVDTRKTTPGLRMLEKYAVRVGGGKNHRFCLSDGVLIKDNHINAVGGISQAISKVRSVIPHTMKIEIETETMDQVKEAIDAGADIIMLDNMTIELMKQAVSYINKRAIVEASGNVSIESIRAIALTGIDIISAGCITHSVNAFDISLRFFPET